MHYYKECFLRLVALFAARFSLAPLLGEYGGRTQTDHWVLERKNHFLKAGNLNNKMKGKETIKKITKQPSTLSSAE